MGWYFCVLSAGDVVCRRENREMDVKKRRGSCFFVAHPALQGLRIAPHRRTSNTETHAVCKTPRCRLRGRAWNWHAWTSTVALRSAVCSKIANVLDREAKTCKRLVLYVMCRKRTRRRERWVVSSLIHGTCHGCPFKHVAKIGKVACRNKDCFEA